jgi:hypothetical protein
MSLRLNDLTVQRMKVLDQLSAMRDKVDSVVAKDQMAGRALRSKIAEYEAQVREIEKLMRVEEEQGGQSSDARTKGGREQMASELRKAVQEDNLAKVRSLCADANVSAFINRGNFEGTTPLIKAAIFDQIQIVEALLKAGADPSLTDHMGRTPLMMAAGNGADASVQALLKTKVACETMVATSNGWTAFMYAVQGGHLEASKQLLLACGAHACLSSRAHDCKTVVDLAQECADSSRVAPMLSLLRGAVTEVYGAGDAGEDVDLVAKQLAEAEPTQRKSRSGWNPLQRLAMASKAADAFGEAATSTSAKRSRFSFANVLRRASNILPSFFGIRSSQGPFEGALATGMATKSNSNVKV